MKKSSLKTTCFSTFIFSRFWLHFGCFWEALGPLLGSFGRPKCAPRGWVTLREAYFFLTFFVFVAAFSISFDLVGFGYDFGRVWEGFWEVLGRFSKTFKDFWRFLTIFKKFKGFLRIFEQICGFLKILMDFYGFLEGFQRFLSFGWFWERLGVGSGIWFPQHGKCSHENEKTIVLSLRPSRIHNDEMLILSFSWLHFSCGHHFLGHSVWPGGMREAIK